MKGYELIKAITENKIKDNTTIKVKMGNTYKATLKYENLMLKWESGDFDTSILCSVEANFEAIEENKEIDIQSIKEIDVKDQFYRKDNIDKLNELTRAIKQIDKELNELKSLDYLEISERDINDAIKKAREYMDKEREEK